MKMKDDYNSKFDDNSLNFKHWLISLDNEEYNETFKCIETTQHNNIILIRYGLLHEVEGLFSDEDSIYRECRSIVINLETEEIVVAPFKKFFNLNQMPETSLENIHKKLINTPTFEITNKLDGSMQCARWYNGEVFMSGSRSVNKEESWRLTDGYSMLTNNHKNMLAFNADFTFIFEYISLKDAHVVKYNKMDEGLYLIGVRNTLTGEQFSYNIIKDIAKLFKVPVVEQEYLTIDEMLEQMKTVKSTDKEGWVMNINGLLVKIKCDDYVDVHRILDKASSANVIIRAIADNTYDDLISKIPDSYKKRVENIADLVFKYTKDMYNNIDYYLHNIPTGDRKEIMIWIEKNVPKKYAKYVRSKFLGEDINVLKTKSGKYIIMKEMGYTDKYSAMFHNEESNGNI